MESALIWFFSLSSTIQMGIAGGLGAGLGAGIGHLVGQKLKLQKSAMYLSIVAVVVGMQSATAWVKVNEKKMAPVIVIKGLNENPLFAALFRAHPEAEADLRTRLDGAFKSGSNEEISSQVAIATSSIVATYFSPHISTGSDDSVHALAHQNHAAMKVLAKYPKACVDYYMGRPVGNVLNEFPELIATETKIKADVVESSVAAGATMQPSATLDEIGTQIRDAYAARGYPIEEVVNLGRVDAMDPVEGCATATRFHDVLAALPPTQSAFLMRGLMSLTQPPK